MPIDIFSKLKPRLLGEKVKDIETATKLAEKCLPLSGKFRSLLKTIGGAIVFEKGAKFLADEKSPLGDKDGYQSLEILYGLGRGKNSIEQNVAIYDGELPSTFVPIGESAGGNLICIAGDGSIHLWDHESFRDGGTWRIATSLDKFLNRLEPNDSEIGTTEPIIESKSFLDF